MSALPFCLLLIIMGFTVGPRLAWCAETPTNRLIHSADPYLLLHAHNPVDWYPWGPEAFAKAKAENKPIFLSIGYSTCYWCHVAEKEIYSNPAITALMNKWFVNVKVDREERPDVDRLYIIATEMLTDHGAWPNNLFLTPELKPFYAGSYFPPKDGPGGPGFPTILAAIHDLWEHHRAEKIDPAANEVFGALQKIEQAQATRAEVPVAPVAWLGEASEALLARVDPVNGGFGDPKAGQKFPQAPALDLLHAAAIRGDAGAAAALSHALDAMAEGGIHDQLGGGFHRYATEPTWSIPHFEKMLYDNAQLLRLYAESEAPRDRAVARDIASYLTRDMTAAGGGFFTAQDAETNGIEGATYLWTRQQIEAVLGAPAATRFLDVYELRAVPDQEGGVPRLRLPLADTLKRGGAKDVSALLASLAPERAKLLAARDKRPQPERDDKIVASLNGLAIDAFARASVSLGEPALLGPAKAAADRLWSDAYDPKTGALKHQLFAGKAQGDGYLDDYAMLGDGMLSLAEASHDAQWRSRAETLADSLVARFMKPDGRLATDVDGDALPVALEDGEDSDVPSGASSALSLLTRLAAEPNGARFAAPAAAIATHLSGRIARAPAAWPSAIVALVTHPLGASALASVAPTIVASTTAPAQSVPGVPSTADHVHVSAAVVPGANGDTIAVTLRIDDGFHINAHVPTLDYLVPTDATFAGVTAEATRYPPSQLFKSAFAPDGIAVYEGHVSLQATFAKASLAGLKSLKGAVTAQACDKQTCLPPATLPVLVTMPRE